MAHDEMNTIKELDVELLRYHQRHINFYFAEKDDWVGEQREVVLSAIDADPGSVKVVHGEKDIPHAFCISEYFWTLPSPQDKNSRWSIQIMVSSLPRNAFNGC